MSVLCCTFSALLVGLDRRWSPPQIVIPGMCSTSGMIPDLDKEDKKASNGNQGFVETPTVRIYQVLTGAVDAP